MPGAQPHHFRGGSNDYYGGDPPGQPLVEQEENQYTFYREEMEIQRIAHLSNSRIPSIGELNVLAHFFGGRRNPPYWRTRREAERQKDEEITVIRFLVANVKPCEGGLGLDLA